MERIAGGMAQELMDSDFVHAGPEESLDDVLQRQVEHDVDDMAVTDEQGRLVGDRVLQGSEDLEPSTHRPQAGLATGPGGSFS